MLTILLLLCAAALLLCLEAVLPGGILGSIGGLFLLVAIVFAYQDHGWLYAGLIALGGIALTTAVFYVQLHVLPRTRFGKNIQLQTRSEGHSVDKLSALDLTGKTGRVLTRMAPSGMVQIGEQSYEARSESGLLETGETVEVTGTSSNRLTVRKV